MTNQLAKMAVGFQDLAVKWTAGNGGGYVYITGGSGRAAAFVSFECLAHANDGQFTVPSHILMALPPGNGGINLQNQIYAPLSASGLDVAGAAADIEFSETAIFK